MKDSLKYWMKEFPFFIDKSKDSNFYKTSKVLNDNFREFRNDLFVVHNAHRLKKNILIWKETEEVTEIIGGEEVTYLEDTYHFYCNYPYLKEITFFQNELIIQQDNFTYEENQSEWYYEIKLINSDMQYILKVETWEEYLIEKGFPENDTAQGDVFDHDISLDEFGELYDLPRKKYVYTETTNPENTEPPYNNRLTEDDYHYMNRILYYIEHFDTIPLPVLEIWKLYGIPLDKILFVNRSHQLCKMYSEKRHPDPNWTPREWEHKDPMWCPKPEKAFFFVTLDNYTPVHGNLINFRFDFFDMYGMDLEKAYVIDAYMNDELIASDLDPEKKFTFDTGSTEEYEMQFYFIAKPVDETHVELRSDFFNVITKGCGNGDWYVDAETGSDILGDGTSDKPFKTLPFALTHVESNKNTIVLKNGTYPIPDELTIVTPTNILGCSSATIVSDTKNFFKILNGQSLYLSNITLKYNLNELFSHDDLFFNHNINENPTYIRLLFIYEVADVGLNIFDSEGQPVTSVSWQLNDYIVLEACLLTEDGERIPTAGETIEFYQITED